MAIEKKTTIVKIEIDSENYNKIFVTKKIEIVEDGIVISEAGRTCTCYEPDTDTLDVPEDTRPLAAAIWTPETVDGFKQYKAEEKAKRDEEKAKRDALLKTEKEKVEEPE